MFCEALAGGRRMPRTERADCPQTKMKKGAKTKEGAQRTMAVLTDPLVRRRPGAGKEKSTLDERVMRRLGAASAFPLDPEGHDRGPVRLIGKPIHLRLGPAAPADSN